MSKVLGKLTQEMIVFLLAAVLFIAASVFLDGFMFKDGAFQAGNLITMVRSVSVLGILAVGMGIVIIGRGIDLSAVAVMAMSVAWYLQMLNSGVPEWQALGWALAGVIAIGLINGFMAAYADVPAIFVTLATSYFVYGFVRSQLIVSGCDAGPRRQLDPRTAESQSGHSDSYPSRCLRLRRRRLPGVPVPALHEMGPLHLSDGRQFHGGAEHGRAGAADHRSLLCDLGADGIRGRHPDHVQHPEHERAGGELPTCSTTSSWSA